MNESDSQKIRAAIETLAEVFDRSLTDAALNLYVQAIGDLEVAAVDTAISAAAAGRMNFPSPGEIRVPPCAIIRSPFRPSVGRQQLWRGLVRAASVICIVTARGGDSCNVAWHQRADLSRSRINVTPTAPTPPSGSSA